MDTNNFSPTEYAESLRNRFQQVIQKLTRKLQKQQEELEESKKHQWYQQIGDSLLSSAQVISPGTAEIILMNIHTQQNEKIPLNPKLDKNQNAQLFYKKSKRAKRGEDISYKKVTATSLELQNILSIRKKFDEYLKNDPDSMELKEFESMLETAATSQNTMQNTSTARPVEKVPYRHFTTEGWDIFIGKNDSQNDELSTRFARPSDLWFHVAGHAGSHVIIKRPKDTPLPPKEILEIAASLSIWFSKAKHTSFAEVHYTEARFVHKRRHAPPGEVIAERCKSIRTSPRSPQDIFKTPFFEE